MPPPSTKPRDPLAMAFLAVVAVLLVIGVVLGARALLPRPVPSAGTPPPATGLSLLALRQSLQRAADELAARLLFFVAPQTPPAKSPAPAQARVAPAPPAVSVNDPQRVYRPVAAPVSPHVLAVPANAAWTYDVFFGPSWKKAIQFRYDTQKSVQGKTGATLSWTGYGGKTANHFLGIVEADHASHADTRFPGFFMHPVYFPQTLAPGARLLWEFPWQDANGRRQTERVRRYDMKVIAWERLTLPAGEFDAVRLEGKMLYVESENVKAEVAYTLWYAPRAKQIVRLRWIGSAPDESITEIIAELVSYRGP